jgi:hypothetical protein
MFNHFLLFLLLLCAKYLTASDISFQDVAISKDEQRVSTPLKRLPTDLSSKPFDRVITLGDSCIAKKQVGFYFTMEKSYTGGAYLFDWTLILSLPIFCKAIENNFSGIGENFSVKDRYPGSHPTITDGINIAYPHIIPKKEWKHTEQDLLLLTQDPLDKKISYLKEKTIKAMHDRSIYTLFIFSIKQCGGTLEEVMVLYETLLKLRGKTFVLICTTENPLPDHIPSLSYDGFFQIHQMPNSGEWEEWIKKPLPQWKELLDKFTFNPGDHNLKWE